MHSYEILEDKLVKLLSRFGKLMQDEDSGFVQKQKQELFTIMMALMSLCRSSLIHPIVPHGREITKQFSPSRRHLLPAEERSKMCVCCNEQLRPSVPLPPKAHEETPEGDEASSNSFGNRRVLDDGFTLEDDNDNNDDDALLAHEETKEELVPLPSECCDSPKVKHFAHKKCLEALKQLREKCPRCTDIGRRLHIMKHAESTKSGANYRTYCEHISVLPGISAGFKASAKIEEIVSWFRSVPPGDKVCPKENRFEMTRGDISLSISSLRLRSSS